MQSESDQKNYAITLPFEDRELIIIGKDGEIMTFHSKSVARRFIASMPPQTQTVAKIGPAPCEDE